GLSTPRPRTSSDCDPEACQQSVRWRCVSLRSGSKVSRDLFKENHCVEFMNAFSASSLWKANPSIRVCKIVFRLQARIHRAVFLPTHHPVLLDEIVARAEPQVGARAVRCCVG